MSEPGERRGGRAALVRLLIVVLGIVVGQAVLYGPCLSGKKIMLPLDMLAKPRFYLPATPESAKIVAHDVYLMDLISVFEPARRFAVSELHAGRFPTWSNYQYAGCPFTWPKFSPFLLLECCTASPVILAWVQLLCAVVAGTGAYVFFRRALGVRFWAAAIPAWCYPLTGFFVFWMGFPTGMAVYWLPWLLLAVDTTVRRASLGGLAGLGLATGLASVSGHIDVAGQVLLTSGLYGLWRWFECYGREWRQSRAWRAMLLLAAGWGLGLMLAMPQILPLMEYARTGARVARRAHGEEDRPPVGLAALPEMVFPDYRGVTRAGHVRLSEQNQIESPAAIYTGVVAAFFLAPLAWCSRRHRSINLFWCVLILLAAGWCLDIPGIVAALRLPGFNMMSYNRWVFAASFAILALGAVGLETLAQGEVCWRRWFWLPAAVLAGLCAWSVLRGLTLPGEFKTIYEMAKNRGDVSGSVPDEQLGQVAHWFGVSSAAAAVWCGLGAGCWLWLRFRPTWRPLALAGLAAILLGDLLWFARDRCAQCDPALYYPKIPALEQIARAGPGRVLGCDCLPATFTETAGLHDLRGYDAIDPARLVVLMEIARDTRFPNFGYALTQWYVPQVKQTPPGIEVSPILDMLNVRYLIFRGEPPQNLRPIFTSPDYWVMENTYALPRAIVPKRVASVADSQECYAQLCRPDFDALEKAYVETNLDLPGACQGSAEIVSETPNRVTVAVKMQTPGLVVLADLWNQGWRAYLDGKPAPIYRTNFALRGVPVPAGNATLEFRYEPASLRWGLRLAGLSGMILLACGAGAWFGRGFNNPRTVSEGPSGGAS